MIVTLRLSVLAVSDGVALSLPAGFSGLIAALGILCLAGFVITFGFAVVFAVGLFVALSSTLIAIGLTVSAPGTAAVLLISR